VGAAAAAALLVAACEEAPSAEKDVYNPASVTEVEGSELKQVTITDAGAARLALETAVATTVDGRTAVPYAALIYDGKGATWVYTSPEKRVFLRARVQVERVERDLVVITKGVSPGTRVVTTGAAEVYGAELGIDGSH
jgi:hypothetical protein